MNAENYSSAKFSILIKMICEENKSRKHPKQVFDDVIQLAFKLALSNEFRLLTSQYFEHFYLNPKHDLYKSLDSYEKDSRAFSLLKEATLELFKIIKESKPFEDLIGSLYDEYLGQILGQFFTPKDISSLLATLLQETTPDFSKPFMVGDVCSGAGSLILAQLKMFYETGGKDALKMAHVHCIDIDPKMIQLATIQIFLHSVLHGVPIGSIQMHLGNAITDYKAEDTLAFCAISKQEPAGFKIIEKILKGFSEMRVS